MDQGVVMVKREAAMASASFFTRRTENKTEVYAKMASLSVTQNKNPNTKQLN